MYAANLLPATRRAARSTHTRIKLWSAIGAAYCALVIGGVALAHVILGAQYHNAAVDLEREDLHIKQLMADSLDLRKQLTGAVALRQSVREVTDQPDWSIILTALPSLGGDEMVLREVKLHPVETNVIVSATAKKDAKPQESLREFTLEMKGVCKSQPGVAKFVLALQQANIFEEVKLVRTAREPFMDQMAVSFEVQCTMGDAR
jgi:Tfp pilus assembly protein PilN